MKDKLNKSEFGNQKHISVQHYLLRMLHRIIEATDKNNKGEVNEVLFLFVDMKQAYLRQDHTFFPF